MMCDYLNSFMAHESCLRTLHAYVSMDLEYRLPTKDVHNNLSYYILRIFFPMRAD